MAQKRLFEKNRRAPARGEHGSRSRISFPLPVFDDSLVWLDPPSRNSEPGCATTQATVRSKIVVFPSDFLFENWVLESETANSSDRLRFKHTGLPSSTLGVAVEGRE